MAETDRTDTPKPTPICAIGASAGGVGALKELFSHLPDDLGVAYVVIIHLAPDLPSSLSEILAGVTRMPVQQVSDAPKLSPNCVYVIPPDRELVIQGDDVMARPFSQPRGQRAPIDQFFRSVAAGRGDGMAVILSGSGSDGALGVRAIKEAGGVIFVQEPATAEYPMMPRSALAAGVADFVAPIPRLVERMIEVMASKRAMGALAEDSAERVIERIMGFLRARTGHDFSSYKRATVLRRVGRRMQVSRSGSLAGYVQYLVNNPEEAQELLADLLISVTSFFRDPAAYEALAAAVIGQIFDGASEEGIRAWVVGCATGEEAYSLAILFLEEAARRQVSIPIQIFATDLDEGALATAREGRYPGSIEADVSEERLQRFFVREGAHYRIRSEVRDVVLFASHSVLKDPPFMRLDLVSCRNLLIYLERELQREVCALFAYGLRANRYLFLGSAETTDASPELFAAVDRDSRIFRVRSQGPRRLPVISQLPPGHRPPGLDRARTTPVEDRGRGLAAIHVGALERAAPPSALVDHDFNALHLSPNAGRFLLPPAGPFSSDIASLVRPELRLDLRAAVRRALDSNQPTLTPPIAVAFNGHRNRVMMQVTPVTDDGDAPPMQALVVFIDAGPVSTVEEIAEDGAPLGEVQRLREELNAAESRLGGARADHEAAIQDLRVANEELQSINEEYRSTSEELETSKEELQSMNEELQTVNAELKSKLETIGAAHSDLKNIIAATEIGTLFLDPKMRIRMFTPRVARIFNVTEADIGRAITDFTHLLNYDDLVCDAERVLRELSPREREVESRDGRWHMMRLRPYRTIDDRINGVVVTFVDITEHREATALLRESEERFRAFVRASSDAIYRMTPDWSEMRKLGGRGLPAEAEDPRQNWADDYVLSEDLARFRESVAAAIRDKQSFALEHRVRLPDGSIGWILSRAVPIFGEDGEIIEWFGTASDITERRRSEEALREARDALALATQASRLGWGTWNFASGSAVWDDRGREILGLREDEDRIDDWFARIVPEDREAVPREIAACARENRPFELDYGVEHRDGSVHQILGTGTFDSDAEGHPTRGTGLVRDVTDMRRWEESQRLLVGELNHRVKNMLAVVQSIAQQTQRSSDSIEAFTDALGRRIQALAAAHGLLTRQNWTGANLGELVEAAAVTFTDPQDGDRLRIDGPRLNLRPDVVITFAMAIHELGTNSMKHGALSVPEGRVAVTWTAGEGGVAFDWIETGGPPVAPPVRKGFGTRLLERGIARELEGSAHLDYREEGFRFHLEFPVNGFFRPT